MRGAAMQPSDRSKVEPISRLPTHRLELTRRSPQRALLRANQLTHHPKMRILRREVASPNYAAPVGGCGLTH